MTAWTLVALAGVVAFGAVVPVVPTGAAVSASAALARGAELWQVPFVVLAGAAGAYAGDLCTYGALRAWGVPLARRVGWLRSDNPRAALTRLRARIEAHELRTLLVSRLIPGGRVPVLLAAALGGYPWRRYAVVSVAATLLWSTTYAVIGLLSGLVPDPRASVIVAVVAAITLTAAARLIQARRRSRLSLSPDGPLGPSTPGQDHSLIEE